MKPSIDDIRFRSSLKPGDMGQIIHLHGKLYHLEQGYGLSLETYVASALTAFCQQYDATKDAVWVAEHQQRMVGFLALMHRPKQTAQLRFFLVLPAYRNIGLGKHMMNLFMQTLTDRNYRCAYLWTAEGLPASAALYRRHGFVLTEEKASTAFGIPLTEQRFDLNCHQ